MIGNHWPQRTLLCCIALCWACSPCIGDDGETQLRIWRDQTGKHEIEAVILGVASGRVQLRKPDGQIASPPLSLLSEEDQRYVETWQRERGGAPNGETNDAASNQDGDNAPRSESRPLPSWRPGSDPVNVSSGRRLMVQSMPRPKAFNPDPSPTHATDGETKIQLIPKQKGLAGGQRPLLIDTNTRRNLLRMQQGTWDKEKFTQAIVFEPKSGQASPTTRWDEPLFFVASHPESGRVLARAKTGSWGATGELILLSTSRRGNLREMVRWTPDPEDPDNKPAVRDPQFINDHSVYARTGDTLRLWDLSKRREKWHLIVSGWHHPALSLGGKYLAAQREKIIGIFEATSGNQIGSIELPQPAPVDLAFSPNGEKLAAVTARTILIFDLLDDTNDTTIQLTDPIDTFYSDPAWVNEFHLLVGGQKLVDVSRGHLIWTYDSGGQANNELAIQGGCLQGSVQGSQGLAILALPMPHEAAIDAALQADFENDVRIDRGDAVRIETDLYGSTDRTKVRQLLEQGIEKAGWTIDENAKNVVRFENYRTIEKRSKFGSGRFKEQELPFRPYVGILDVIVNGETVYRRVDAGRAPEKMEIGLEETLAEAIERQTLPSYRLLERLDLPTQIIAPEFQQGLGRSKISAEGWIPDDSFEKSLAEKPPRDSSR